MIKFSKPDEEALKSFLVNEKGFVEQRVESGLKKLQGAQTKVNQSRLDCFFKSAGVSQSKIVQSKNIRKSASTGRKKWLINV